MKYDSKPQPEFLFATMSDDAKRFYARAGFHECPVDPMMMMITLAEVEKNLSPPSAKRVTPLAARAQGVTREHLESFPVFVTDGAGDYHALLTGALVDRTGHLPHVESTGSVEAVKKAVCEHPAGIGMLPAYAIAEELRSGTFAAIHLRPGLPTLRIETWTSSTRESHPRSARFRGSLGESCQHAVPERRAAVGAV